MRNKLITSAILLTLLTATVSAQVMDRPAATVNLIRPEFISVKQLEERVKQVNSLRVQTGITTLPNKLEEVLDSMISEVLLKQGAERAKIKVTDAELNERVSSQKRTFELQLGVQLSDNQFRDLIVNQARLAWDDYVGQVKDQLVQTKYIKLAKQDLFQAIGTPSEAEINKRYRDNATTFINPEMIRFNQIYIDTRVLTSEEKKQALNRAEDIYREFQNGVDTFANLVLKYSDDTASRYKGGDFGYLLRNDARRVSMFGSGFFDEVFALEISDVKGVIESSIGFHIVEITDHRTAKLLTLDDPLSPTNSITVREYIENLVISEQQQVTLRQAMSEVVKDLKSEADIEIFHKNLSSG